MVKTALIQKLLFIKKDKESSQKAAFLCYNFFIGMITMNLKKYDGKCIKLEDIFGNIYEGNSTYNSEEYNECEYGNAEESLNMFPIMFYKSIIKKIESLENHRGPFGKFSAKYGELEKSIVESGVDLIEEALDCEDNISIYRLLLYLEENPVSFSYQEKEQLIKQLNVLIKYNNDKNIIENAKKIKKSLEEIYQEI